MADNAVVNGVTVAADNISGAHHQRIKMGHGADGSSTDVSTASGLPVQGQGLVTSVAKADINAHPFTPSGDDITFRFLHSGLFGSSDGLAYGTSAKIMIPMASSSLGMWREVSIIFDIDTGHDQAIAVVVDAGGVSQGQSGRLESFTIPASTAMEIVLGSGGIGQGGNAGGATAADKDYYGVPGLGIIVPHITIVLTATQPSSGTFENFYIARAV